MSIETIRITKEGRDQLSKLKKRTGIGQWNILCRWAVCLSLADPSQPREVKSSERPIEIDWETFGKQYADVYLALIKERCLQDGRDPTPTVQGEQFHAHLHRGISFLAGDRSIRNIEDLIDKLL